MGLMDIAMSLAAYAGTRRFSPTVELKAIFLSPLPIGPVEAVARVVKAGRTLVFLEGVLSVPGGAVCIAATATTIMREE